MQVQSLRLRRFLKVCLWPWFQCCQPGCSYSMDRSTRTTGQWVQSRLSVMSFLSPFSDSSTSWWTRAVVTLQWGLPHTLSCIATTRDSCKSWGGVGEGPRTRAFLLTREGESKRKKDMVWGRVGGGADMKSFCPKAPRAEHDPSHSLSIWTGSRASPLLWLQFRRLNRLVVSASHHVLTWGLLWVVTHDLRKMKTWA